MKWNPSIRLTGSTKPTDLKRHATEAEALLVHLEGHRRVIDIGSGGGFPAIPLALALPEVSFQLVEPIAKKVAFLNACRRELKLTNVLVRRGRDEELWTEDFELFDVAISQATFKPPEWLERGLRLVKPGGLVLAMLGPKPGELPADVLCIDTPFDEGFRQIARRLKGVEGA